ncbi:MAG TPA: hypothetical protein VNZ61_16085, partial [Roseomonas sp.]|nr:hypothetical protein [Roseomonas sp.]
PHQHRFRSTSTVTQSQMPSAKLNLKQGQTKPELLYSRKPDTIVNQLCGTFYTAPAQPSSRIFGPLSHRQKIFLTNTWYLGNSTS